MLDTRLNNAVLRGEIDNTRRGLTRITLWLKAIAEPLSINLEGDCLSDLAGSHLTFTNKAPVEETIALDFSALKTGHVGEITASDRMFTTEEVDGSNSSTQSPSTKRNLLRLEFFCDIGRFILESSDFVCNLEKKVWTLDPAEEFAQSASNASLWQQHIASSSVYKGERSLEAYADLYDEISLRFADSLEFDQHESYLMGWDGILSILAEENGSPTGFEQIEDPNLDSLPEQIEAYLTEELESGEALFTEWLETKETHPVLESLADLSEDLYLLSAQKVVPQGRGFLALIQTLQEIEIDLKSTLSREPSQLSLTQPPLLNYRKPLGQMVLCLTQLSHLFKITETSAGRRELIFIRDIMLDLRDDISELRFEVNNL